MPTDGEDDDRSTRIDTTNTRRRFLAGSAALGGLAVGGAFASQPAFAQEGDDGDDGPPDENPTEGEFEDDVDVLNYALTLEHLEAEFYRDALDNLDADDIECADAFESSGDSENSDSSDGEDDGSDRSFEELNVDQVYEELEVIRDHEITHVETFIAVIEDLGGDPVEKPEFDFGGATEDPDAFLETAAALENTGVSAYNGAIASIETPELQTAGATVATVEGRHASFLNELNGEIGFPDAFDPARSREEVLEIASQFIADDMDEMMDDEDDSDSEDADSDDASASSDDGDSSDDGNSSDSNGDHSNHDHSNGDSGNGDY